MINSKKAANAVGGKTARPCDGCLVKRARWYCSADDAFLCQACDSSVHSANQLASRHQRVRLETIKVSSEPTWHKNFTRKPRTPRPKPALGVQQPKEEEKIVDQYSLALVPEIDGEEVSFDESEAQRLFLVPVFDPFSSVAEGSKSGKEFEEAGDLDNLHGFFPWDMELEDFSADVESLLGTGIDDESCGIEALGLLGRKEEDDRRSVKAEDEDVEMDMRTRETIDWNFDSDSPVTGEEVKLVSAVEMRGMSGEYCKAEVGRKFCLKLNYEGVMGAWPCSSPWTTGIRPEFCPKDYLPDFMGWCPTTSLGGHGRCCDGEREARVSRYKEKRRTRLFSKKIRYEVRKVNAEKRPRMKGRFVKTTSSLAAGRAFFRTRLPADS